MVPRGTALALSELVSFSRRALVTVIVAAFVAPSAWARADDGVDHALDVARPRSTLGVGYTLGASSSLELPMSTSSFDPADPRVGVILLAAYGPSPFFVLDMLAAESEGRELTIFELLAASVGLVVSVSGFADALSREQGMGLAVGSMATAQALAMNLQMLTNGIERLVFGNILGTPREALRPTFLPVPFQGGAGLVLRWTT
jgi:hypothetical protein